MSGNTGEASDDVASAFSEVLHRLHAADTIDEIDAIIARGIKHLKGLPSPGDLAQQPAIFADLLSQHRTLRISRITRTPPGDSAPGADSTTDDLTKADLTPLGLTRREVEVLTWIAHGKRDAEIGTILGISKRTIGKHVENILRKLQVENRTAAVAAARSRKA